MEAVQYARRTDSLQRLIIVAVWISFFLTRPRETWIHMGAFMLSGLTFEVLATGLTARRGRPQEGYFSLWALPLYAIAPFTYEPLYHLLRDSLFFPGAFVLRGIIYALGVECAEVFYLTIVKAVFDREPWGYEGRGVIYGGRTKLYYLPYWFVVCLVWEYLSNFLASHASCFLS